MTKVHRTETSPYSDIRSIKLFKMLTKLFFYLIAPLSLYLFFHSEACQGCDQGWGNGASGSTGHECSKSWKCAVWWIWQGCLCDDRGDSVDGKKAYRNMGKVVLRVLAGKSGAIGATKRKVATWMCESVLNCGLHQMMRPQYCGCGSGCNGIRPQLRGDSKSQE